jgi:hypothetical protein
MGILRSCLDFEELTSGSIDREREQEQEGAPVYGDVIVDLLRHALRYRDEEVEIRGPF